MQHHVERISTMNPVRMKLAGTLLGGAMALAGLTGLPVQDAEARSRYETCQSRYDRYQYCRTDTRGGVRLQRQLSKSDCTQGQTWGYDRGGIWVDRGCRAEFVIGSDGGYDRDGDSDYGRDRGRDRDRDNNGGYDQGYGRDESRNPGGSYGSRRLVCDAQGPGYRLCRVDTRGGVRMIRQLSKTPCRQNQTWGYERGGVWVDGGCRAEFEVR